MCSFLLTSFVRETVENSPDKTSAIPSLKTDGASDLLPGASNNGVLRLRGKDATVGTKLSIEFGSLTDNGNALSVRKKAFANKLDKLDDSTVQKFPDILENKNYASVIKVFPARKEDTKESDFDTETLEDVEDKHYVMEEIPSAVENVSVNETPLFVEEMYYSSESLSSCLRENGRLSAFTNNLRLQYSIPQSEDSTTSSPRMTCSATATTKPELVFKLDLWDQSGSVDCSFRNYVTISDAGKKNMTWYFSCDMETISYFGSSGSLVVMEIVVGDSSSGHGFIIDAFAVASGLELVHLSPTQGTMYSLTTDHLSLQTTFSETTPSQSRLTKRHPSLSTTYVWGKNLKQS